MDDFDKSIERENLINTNDIFSRDLFKINWKIYSEQDIQKILYLFYDYLDFDVKNLHEADRANESGADLIVSNKEKSIAIAVKVKPKKSDYAQALELFERTENEKLYFFVETPTVDFMDKFKKFDNKIELISMADFMQRYCFEKNPRLFFQLVLTNKTKIDYYMNLISYYFIKILKLRKSKLKSTTKISKNGLKQLWRLKDLAVELHKTTNSLSVFYESRKTIDKYEEAKRFFIQIKDFEDNLKKFSSVLASFYEGNQSFLAKNVRETFLDSDWLSLCAINDISIRPADLNKFLNNYKNKNQKEQDFLKKIAEMTSKTIPVIDNSDNNFSDIFYNFLRYLNEAGLFFEYRIDNFFLQAIGGKFKRGNREFIEPTN